MLHVVLNLIITGIPSILNTPLPYIELIQSFKPYYNWNTFNTLDLNKNIDFMVDWFTFQGVATFNQNREILVLFHFLY